MSVHPRADVRPLAALLLLAAGCPAPGFCIGGEYPAWGDEVLAFLAEAMRR